MAARVVLIVAIIVVIIAIGLAAALVFLSSSQTMTTSTSSSISTTQSTSQSSSASLVTSISTFGTNGNYSASWLTYHRDLVRSGYDPDEPQYSSTPPSLAWKSPMFDGAVYAEPLIYNGMVFAVTENDSVYALSQATGQIIWRQNLGTPVPGNTLPCGDINPSGITSTPGNRSQQGRDFCRCVPLPPAAARAVCSKSPKWKCRLSKNCESSRCQPANRAAEGGAFSS